MPTTGGSPSYSNVSQELLGCNFFKRLRYKSSGFLESHFVWGEWFFLPTRSYRTARVSDERIGIRVNDEQAAAIRGCVEPFKRAGPGL